MVRLRKRRESTILLGTIHYTSSIKRPILAKKHFKLFNKHFLRLFNKNTVKLNYSSANNATSVTIDPSLGLLIKVMVATLV